MFGSRNLSRLTVICALITALSWTMVAQDLDDVTITGRLTDPNGLAIVGATVTAASVESGVVRTVTTDEDGRYRIVELKPGTYRV